jgi:hypothetical protein
LKVRIAEPEEKPDAKQWLVKNNSTEMNIYTTEELLETLLSIQPMLRLYND